MKLKIHPSENCTSIKLCVKHKNESYLTFASQGILRNDWAAARRTSVGFSFLVKQLLIVGTLQENPALPKARRARII